MKRTMRVAAAVVCLLFCISFAGCGSSLEDAKVIDTLRYSKVTYAQNSEEISTGVVAENDTWQLEWDQKNKRVSFVEKATGNVWGQTPIESISLQPDENGIRRKNHPQVESAIQVFYQNTTNMVEESAWSYNDAVRAERADDIESGVYTMKIENGLRVVYDFYNFEIMVPVDYKLEGDRFTVSVDPTKIADNGENVATGVSIAPFMCGVKNGAEDSWIFMPDGAGTIIEPNDVDTVGDTGSLPVYGRDLIIQNYAFMSKRQQVTMPVYGVKKGDKALLAVIEGGAESAAINWNVGSENIRYSSVYASFAFRGYNEVVPPRGYSTPAAYIRIFADYINPEVISVAYYALSGDKANINGMAETYRNYLIKKGELKKVNTEEKRVALKYIGGVVQPDSLLGLPSSKLFPMTTTEQAGEMTAAFAEKLGTDFYVDLVGFGESGADIGTYAGGFTTAGKLGGESGMLSLSAKMKELKVPWFMDFNLITFTDGSNGYTVDNHGAVWSNQQTAYFNPHRVLSRMTNNDVRYYLMGRDYLVGAAEELMEEFPSMGLQGISYDSLSSVVYSDYQTGAYSACANMIEDALSIINKTKEKGHTYLADAPNVYAAVNADTILDAPLYSSLFDFSDYDVPFYQLVLRGYVPMNSVSINLTADEEDALLRCVRAGIAPSYTLTYNYDKELITSEHTFIYGSSYEGNKGKILDTADTLKGYLESIEGATITGYDVISDDVSVTRYSNGVYAVVNLGDTEAQTDYGKVPADSWITGRVAE
ncbi:MAG: hypothetical protein E7541_04125 [Ruminococcaceae bacterium]|nr:hypothetical protein [Oscillospiraceae bacterium]